MMRRPGMSKSAIEAALFVENRTRCKPPLPDNEVRRIANSIGSYPPSVSIVSEIDEGSQESEWPMPQALPDGLPPVERFRFELLPAKLYPWIEDIADRMQCPPDFPAVAAMIALSSVVGRQIGIRPKKSDDWTVIPNLWGGVVGRSGVLKTPALREPMRPLDELEARDREQYEGELTLHEADKLVADAKKKEAQERLKKAIKFEDKDPREVALEALGGAVEPPSRRRHLVNDTTVEKLGEILSANPRGVLLFRDELTGFLKSLVKDGRESDRAFFLEAWNGTGRYTYDRIGRGTIDIEAACVSILGGIQPGPLAAYVSRTARGGADDDGLLQRFQLVVWPDQKREWENKDFSPDQAARTAAYSVYRHLNSLDPSALRAEADGDLPFLRFAPDAQEIFEEWRTELEHMLRSEEEHPMIESHLAKYRSLVPSLALLIHLAEQNVGPVDATALHRACAWDDYLQTHARRVYAPALSPGTNAAKVVAAHLVRGDLGSRFAARDVQRKNWRGLADLEDIKQGLKVLEDYSWVRSVRIPTSGRTAFCYDINPKIDEAPKTNGKVA